MRLDWIFKSNKDIVSDLLKEYDHKPEEFISKFLNGNDEWRNDITKALHTFTGQGVIWTNDTLETYVDSGYRQNSTLYSIINLITREARKIKFKLFEVVSDEQLTQLKTMKRDHPDYTKYSKKALQLVEDDNHDLLHLLNVQSNPLRSGSEFTEEAIAYKLITGNSYLYMAGPGEDTTNEINFRDVTMDDIEPPKELWALPAHLTRILADGMMNPVAGYEIMYRPTVPLPAARVMHSKMFNPDYTSSTASHLYGMSPLKAGSRTLTANNDTYEAAVKLLQNLGALGIVYKDAEQDFSQENAQALQKQWSNRTGPSNVNKLLFSGAKLGWLKITESAMDLSIYEGQRQTARELANLYGISTILLNDVENTGTFNNMKEAKISMISNSVLPHLTDLRDLYNQKLVPLYEKRDGKKYYLDIDISSIPELRPDLEMTSNVAAKSWWLTIDEKRILMGMDAIPGPQGDQLLVPSNLIPLDETSLLFTPDDRQLNQNFEDDNIEEDDNTNEEDK